VVLTTSRAEQDALKAYDLHANSYITKPIDPDQFLGVIRSIGSFWMSVVSLPPR
jgi:CheY-like chemotaxis protein